MKDVEVVDERRWWFYLKAQEMYKKLNIIVLNHVWFICISPSCLCRLTSSSTLVTFSSVPACLSCWCLWWMLPVF